MVFALMSVATNSRGPIQTTQSEIAGYEGTHSIALVLDASANYRSLCVGQRSWAPARACRSTLSTTRTSAESWASNHARMDRKPDRHCHAVLGRAGVVDGSGRRRRADGVAAGSARRRTTSTSSLSLPAHPTSRCRRPPARAGPVRGRTCVGVRHCQCVRGFVYAFDAATRYLRSGDVKMRR